MITYCDRIKIAWSCVKLEPVIFMFMGMLTLRGPVISTLFYEKSCVNLYGSANLSIDCSNVSVTSKDERIIEYYNRLFWLWTLSSRVPSIFVTIIIGLLCDKWRYKPLMILPFIGFILSNMNFILQSIHMHWNPYYLILADLPFGLCGSFISVLSTIFSYSMLQTDSDNRSKRFAVLEGLGGAGFALGAFFSGRVHDAFGYATVFGTSLILASISALYIFVFIEDIKAVRHVPYDVNLINVHGKFITVLVAIKTHFLDILKPITNVSIYGRLLIVIFIAMAFETFAFSGFNDILYTFLNRRFHWSDKEFGTFVCVNTILSSFSLLALYPLICRCFKIANSSWAVFCILNRIAFLLILSFAYHEWIVYLSVIPWCFERLYFTVTRSIISRMSDDEEQGRVFALLGLIENFVIILATTIYNNAYPRTVGSFDATLFLITAGILLIPMSLFVFVRVKIQHRLSSNDEPLLDDTTEETEQAEQAN